MTAVTDPGLLERLEAFDPDDKDAVFPFSSRLAGENGWTAEFTRRVIVEYKRFVYLAVTAGHPVSPSATVDKAWHLHLIYTRSYWDEMCKDILKRPLHHGPTRGGETEAAKFADWYLKTLQSYDLTFGHSPPPDIWPAPAAICAETGDPQRTGGPFFAATPRPRPPKSGTRRKGSPEEKSPLSASLLRLLLPAAAVVVVFGCHALIEGNASEQGKGTQLTELSRSFNIFNWTAGPFLGLYGVALLLAWGLSVFLRRRSQAIPETGTPVPETELTDLYEQAMLSGGECRVAQTALLSLTLSGAITVTRRKFREAIVTVAGGRPEHPVECAFYDLISRSGPMRLKDLSHRVPAFAFKQQLTERLTRAGLLPGKKRRRLWSTGWPFLILMTVGVIRLCSGIAREKPVGFLVILLMVTAILCFRVTGGNPSRLKRGDRALDRLRKASPQSSAKERPLEAFAVNGPVVLSTLAIPAMMGDIFRRSEQHQREEAGSFSNGVGCGSSCGGGGSGCGGAGCGGCGQ